MKAGEVPPGTMVKYTNVEGEHLVGLVVARKEPLSSGGDAIHLVIWSNGSMSQHLFCERLF